MRTLRTWLAGLGERERRLVVAGAALAGVLAAVMAVVAVRDDLASLRARVTARERELQQVRRLATSLGPARAPSVVDGALLTRLQAATDAAALADRVTAMTPAPDGEPARLGVRVSGASLAETVRLLHQLDQDGAPLGVGRLALRKHPDDPRRFDVTLEITGDAP